MSLLVSNINVFWHWMHFQSKVSVLHSLQKRLGELDTRRFIRIQKTPQRCKEYLKGCPWYLYIGYTICKVWIKQYFCKRYNVSSLSLICVSFMWHLSFLLKRKKKRIYPKLEGKTQNSLYNKYMLLWFYNNSKQYSNYNLKEEQNRINFVLME
jgi:hypothetical protein